MLPKFLNLIFPHICLLCRQSALTDRDLCAACCKELPFYETYCPQCAAPHNATTCGACLQKAPPYQKTFCLFRYETPITKLIMELKFHEVFANAQVLGELMGHALKHEYYNKSMPELIIPVPLHNKRLRERGFNQATEIAKPIAKITQIPLIINACSRAISTAPQARLSASARQKNLKKAFIINPMIKGKYIAIVDDVATTGQTLFELSSACKKAGAKRIDIWICAKALMR